MDLLQHTHDYSEYFTSFQWVSRPCEETQKQREPTLIKFFLLFFPNQNLFSTKTGDWFLFSTSKKTLFVDKSVN